MPHFVSIQNQSSPLSLPIRAKYCASFVCRLVGLTFQHKIPTGEGILLVHSRDSVMDTTIHMLAVFTDLAVIWIDSDYQIVDIKLARSWHPIYIPKKPARFVLEIATEHITDFNIGDQISIE